MKGLENLEKLTEILLKGFGWLKAVKLVLTGPKDKERRWIGDAMVSLIDFHKASL